MLHYESYKSRNTAFFSSYHRTVVLIGRVYFVQFIRAYRLAWYIDEVFS